MKKIEQLPAVLLFVILPFLSGCSFYPESPLSYLEVPPVELHPESLWYQPIPADPAVDEDSEVIIAKLVDLAEGGMSIGSGPTEWTIPIYYADENDPVVSIRLSNFWTGFGGVRVRMPDYAMPDPEADSHLCIIDTVSGLEFDLWQVRRFKGGWTATNAGIIDYGTDTDGFHDRGGCRATRAALTSGIIWPQELLAGEINHALIFAYPYNRSGGPVPPARGSDGWADDRAAMPEGAHIQLDPAFDVESMDIPDHLKAIYRALQTYGAYNVDNGGAMGFYMVGSSSYSENPYEDLPGYTDWDYIVFEDFPCKHLRVLEMEDQYTHDISGIDLPFEEYYY